MDFYRAEADSVGGRVLELGCGTGQKLIPIAATGHPSVGLDLSLDMLAVARQKAEERGVSVEWQHGDMRDLDLGDEFDLIFIAGNASAAPARG
ncbi:class I SAM-dependent methyltransferase [Microbacterium sp. NRRL B-14842]|uniref:class I SAM-dependent methyltransferase n=1 Tax=Microbacterium sp. NRRL B-14842 TaxID=3162881 RepID=UPI003D28E581